MNLTLDEIKRNFEQESKILNTFAEIEEIRVKFTGRSGFVTEALKKISDIPTDDRKAYGAQVNELKAFITEAIAIKKQDIETSEIKHRLDSESIDITLPVRSNRIGAIHPISNAINEIRDIWEVFFGFEFVDGPEIEDDWHNFTALNIAENHPARQMHDTFYICNTASRLLRTHTSNVQIRAMSKRQPPLRLFTIGKTFRSDSDATHSPMFHQLEGIYVDKHVNVAQLKFCLEQFLQQFFQIDSAPIRLRASHFPFTEPSAEVDVQCNRSLKDQIIIGKGEDWIEILGAGIVHPDILRNCGIDSEEYSGFAFGAGIERLAMLKYNISDLRKFYDGDLRWLKHHGF